MVHITDQQLLQQAPEQANDRLLRLQEHLYRQINLLLPAACNQHDWFVSEINALPALRLQILEQHKYSTFLRLTHDLEDAGERVSEPEAHIRCCHDLRVAEVTAFNQVQGINRIAGPDMLPARLHHIHWRQNRTLSKWLDHLLGLGHSGATMRMTAEQDPAQVNSKTRDKVG
jgi:uncharacterized protein YqiB (DUF1249 family)